VKSGLRRTSIPRLRRADFDQAKAANQDRLDSERRIDDAIRLRNNAVAQKPKAITKSAGRIVAVSSGSYELCPGRNGVFQRLG
jgi:hypothetical protein